MDKNQDVCEAEALIRKVRIKPSPAKLREVLDEIDTRPKLVPMPEVHLGDEKLVIMPDGSRVIGQVREIHHFINKEGKAQTEASFKILRPV